MRARWLALGIAAVALAAPRSAWAYSNEELGFSFSVPGGYRQIPIASEEKYIVARWQSEREYYDRKEKENYFFSYRPEIKVVLFDPKGKFTKEKTEIGEGVSLYTVNNPYKSYKQWVKDEGEGGRYISKEEEVTVGGVPATWYEVAYEKLTTPRHGLAFVYHAEDIDYCVTVEVLEQDWKKLSPSLIAAMKSFKVFARKGVLKRETASGTSPEVVKEEDDTPEGRLKRRREEFDRKLKVCVDRLTPGWNVKWSDSKNYVALTHADAKFTALILDQADGIRQWADETLGFMGEGIPGPCIIRIFKDWDEQNAFENVSSRSGSGMGGVTVTGGGGRISFSFGTFMNEITVCRREGFWGLGSVAGSVYRRWLQDKNEELSWTLPEWLDRGIREWVDHAYFRAGKLDFRPDVNTIVALRTASKQGTLIKVRDLLQMTRKKLAEAERPGLDTGPGGFSSGAYDQASGLVRYLLAGPGKSNPLTRDLLRTYVTNLDAYVTEREEADKTAKPDAPTEKAPQTEEEEEERFKKKQTFWADDSREEELIKTVFEKTFAQWTDAQWATLEKSYRNFAASN